MTEAPGRELIDTTRWPLGDPTCASVLGEVFAREGVVVLPGFVHASVIDQMVKECRDLEEVAHWSRSRSSPYLTAVRADAPAADPRGHEITSSVGVVAYDLVPPGNLVHRLYEDDEMMAFVAAVLGEPVLHRYADPFGALNISVMREGDHLGWHFDMTDFVVSLAIQASESGGEFVNAPRIRHANDECPDDVAAVLEGRSPDKVRVEPMTPGTLMIFNGRWSMHKVAPVVGPCPRIVALLAYDREPGTDSTDELKLSRYGRLPA